MCQRLGARVTRDRGRGGPSGQRPPIQSVRRRNMTMQLEAIVNQPLIETERFDLRPVRRSDMGMI